MKYSYMLFFVLIACHSPKLTMIDCDMKQALWVADAVVKKVGYQRYLLKASIEPIDSIFKVHYLPKDANTRGGEAKVYILQDNCKVVKKEFYQ